MSCTVIVISGEPAAGKTLAAGLLVEHLSGLTIDTDLLCTPLRDAALGLLGLSPADVDGPLYQQRLRPAVYQGLVDTAVHLAQFSYPVIISGPFHPAGFGEVEWAAFRARLEAAGAALYRIHLVAAPALVRRRMTVRGEARDAGKLADWARYQQRWAGVIPADAQVVVNDGSVEELRRKLAAFFPGHSSGSSSDAQLQAR